MFHCNFGRVSYGTVSDINSGDIFKIFTPVVFNAPAEWVPVEILLKKFEKIDLRPYQNVEKFDDVFIRLDILVVPALDRRTDGQNW